MAKNAARRLSFRAIHRESAPRTVPGNDSELPLHAIAAQISETQSANQCLVSMPPNETRLSCGALKNDSFQNVRAPAASSAG